MAVAPEAEHGFGYCAVVSDSFSGDERRSLNGAFYEHVGAGARQMPSAAHGHGAASDSIRPPMSPV